MSENRQRRLVIIMLLVGAIIAATLAVPIWIEQITGESEPNTPVDLPFNTPTQPILETAAPNIVTKPTSTPTQSPTPGEVSADNCTFDVSYWIENQETWPFDVIRIADNTYGQAESYLIIASESEEVSQILLKQIITYMLNIYRGTDPTAIKQTVVESLDWLQAHTNGSELSELDRKNGIDLALGVQAFNQGVVGPGPCPEPIFTLTRPQSLRPIHQKSRCQLNFIRRLLLPDRNLITPNHQGQMNHQSLQHQSLNQHPLQLKSLLLPRNQPNLHLQPRHLRRSNLQHQHLHLPRDE